MSIYDIKQKEIEDDYIGEYLKAITQAKTNKNKRNLLNKIYDDGFADGFDSKERRDKMLDITKEKFNAYREVQFSGVTNMFMVNRVSNLSGLSREECFDIMKNYGKYKKQYGEYKGVK